MMGRYLWDKSFHVLHFSASLAFFLTFVNAIVSKGSGEWIDEMHNVVRL